MIQIDRLRMRLPTGFEHRATSIARTVGKVLAKQSVSRQVSIDVVSISAQNINTNTSDDEIAQMIVNQLIATHVGAS
jgi:hypothetical protein